LTPYPSLQDKDMRNRISALLVMVLALALGGCGYNDIQRLDESVKSAWSEVLNQYQRRADLVPNLVNTVKGFAAQEQQVLTQVTEARARVGSIQATPELLANPQLFAQFQQAQAAMSGALSRLLAVAESYPQLKSDQNFRDLQAQLEGTENRIAVARNRYIKSVQEYNTFIRQFPNNLTAMVFNADVKPNFTVENERAISTPPAVNFEKPAGGSSPPANTAAPGGAPTPAPAPDKTPAPAPDKK
jgi:LemA protein